METVHEPLDLARVAPEPSPSSRRLDLSWFTAQRVTRIVDIAVIVAVTGFVLGQLGLGNLLLNTTPAGGDMGAHVWGPAFLRDHILPHGRLTGWTPDWYDGFPAFEFYMVAPALLIVALNAGFHGWFAVLPAALAAYLGYRAWRAEPRSTRRRLLATAAVLVAVLLIGMPYDVAFKWVTVLGVLSLPIAAYAFGRMAALPFPTPAIFAIATLPFIFNREPTLSGTGNIIGGNLTSTLAGEYSFSLSLTFGLLFLGTLIAGFRTGRYRWIAAVLLALTALCHVIVAIFVLIAAALAFLVWPGRARLVWLACVLPVGGLVSAFWTLPFFARRAYVNDMGWEKLPSPSGHYSALHLLGQFITNSGSYGNAQAEGYRSVVVREYLVPGALQWLVVLAVVGFVVAVFLRIRVGIWLGLVALTMGLGFIIAPESRLWNARLLPFYYLALFLLAALGIGELARAVVVLVSPDPEHPNNVLELALKTGITAVTLAAVVVMVGLPLNALPGETSANGTMKWMGLLSTSDPNPAPDWARWNYTGYENKPAYPEFYGFMNTMAGVGRDHGCGRLMWEYDDPTLERYGTPMAPMLVSMFTDSCIGSMEGLYFESSTTTPFHFIDQRELSYKCSCAQRNLPYGSQLDMTQGVKHMQMMGVKYYAASTAPAKQAADANPDLVPIAQSAPWKVYEVKNSDLVEPLANEPAVLTNHNNGLDWVYGTSDPHSAPKAADGKTTITANGPAMTWYTDPSKWNVYLAADGPSSWARVQDGQQAPVDPAPKATVSNVQMGNDTIDFDVDTTGAPILVKTSYFPNWKVDGAQGPYRVTPNLMVVVPTSNHVHLHYGMTSVDYLAYLFTLVGIAFVVVLARAKPLRMPEPAPASEDRLTRFLSGSRGDDEWRDAWDTEPTIGPPDDGHLHPDVYGSSAAAHGSGAGGINGRDDTDDPDDGRPWPVPPSTTLFGNREPPPDEP
jgi:hypothetical protein